MPQLDKFVFISEYFWLSFSLIIIYIVSTFYILPILLRNIIARRQMIKNLNQFISFSNNINFLVERKYKASLLAKVPVAYFSGPEINNYVVKRIRSFDFISSLFLTTMYPTNKIVSVVSNLSFYRKSIFIYGYCLLNIKRGK